MSNTFSGRVIHISDERVVSDKFKTQSIVVEETSGKYPAKGLFEFVNDRIDSLVNVKQGDEVTVSFNCDARQGNDGRWWGSNKGWRVEIKSAAAPAAQSAAPAQAETHDSESELPF